jgi:GPH family glycoside/pentoside/hexuronide:cation symporter
MALGRGQLLSYGLPALPMAGIYFPVYVFLAPFYAGTVGLSVGVIGAIFIAIRLFDAVSDPVMGWLSDRTTFRLGRRRTWLVLATPIIMVSVLGLLAPPDGIGVGWFAGFLLALTIGWTMYLTPFFAWGAELSGVYEERSRITVWRESIGLVGTIIAAVLYGITDERAGLFHVALFVAITLPIATLIACARVPERPSLAREPARLNGIIAALKGEPIFRRLLLAYFINGAANGLPAGLFLFFVQFRLGADSATGGMLLILYFGAAVSAAPFWIWASARYEKHRVWCWAMIYAGAVFLSALTLGQGDVVGFAIISALSGLALGADLALPSSMQADVVDLDTATSGQHRTGAFFAVWSVATKASVALSGGIALLILEVVGFSGQGDNTVLAITTLALLYAGAPVLLKGIAVAMMWRYPLDKAKQGEIRARIDGSSIGG